MSKETCPNGCDLRGAEIPEESRHYYGEGVTHFSRLIGIEIRGVYDGVLFWCCPDCGLNFHRFPEGHYLRERAERWLTADPEEAA